MLYRFSIFILYSLGLTWTATNNAFWFTFSDSSVLHYLPEFAQNHVHWVGDTIQQSHPLLSPSPPVLSLSQHRGLFHWVGSSHQHAASSEYSGLISFRIEWFDLLEVQGALMGPRFKCINFLALSLLYDPTVTWLLEKHSFDFVGKVMSLLFNTLSRFVIAFLLRSKRLLIPWLQSPSRVILEPKKIKSVTVPFFPYLFAMK